ncbi:MAG TPA: sulfotransferase domain-containing protein [Acidimicrobiales bacterium]|nr:sulfotransferase domain-containing protein [Acidimicrobiales bacterium]
MAFRSGDAVRTRLTVDQKRRVAQARLRLREPTARWRRLPDLLVIGAQRGGTSSLYRYLGGHPQVVPSVRKETEYFSRRYGNGELWYRGHFPLRRSGLTFEATPDYLYHPLAPERAAATVPDARIVVLFRDPVERAISHWQHMTRLGFETLTFREAIAAESGRIDADYADIAAGVAVDEGPVLRFSYRSRGCYDEQLERWLSHYPRERVLVLRSEVLFADPASSMAELERFAGLSPGRHASFRNWSAPSAADRSAAPTPIVEADDRETLDELHAFFEPHNARLADLLEVEAWWP